MTVRLKWSAAAVTTNTGLKGKVNIPYIYGPSGNGAGKPKVSGTCNVLRAQTIGGADPSALTELETELNINTEVHGVFP